MLRKQLSILLLTTLLVAGKMYAQSPCTTLGQNPSTAFPVCGTSVFQQDSVPICWSHNLYIPGCSTWGVDTTYYKNKNPFWYKFTCFQSGTLSFVIIPNQMNEDYDWQLYDVTGRNPDDVYWDTTLIVAGNWAGTYDSTGASSTGVNWLQCASEPTTMMPTFALSPDLIQGHNYLLLVSHFSDTEQGYSLSFGGGTAVITDTVPPHMFTATNSTCDGSQIIVKLNKKMKCSTLAADGSDFIISPPNATITSAVGFGCSNAFDMDSILITFSIPLPFGNYDLIARNGIDGNTILDLCDNGIPVNETIPFSVHSPLPVPFDRLMSEKCRADSIVIIFNDDIKCSSVAADGSDFRITGPYPVTISSAFSQNCFNGATRRITVHFASPMIQPGDFQVVLQTGTDGNTLLSKCDTPSVAGSAIPFTILPKPVAAFGFPGSVCLPNASIQFDDLSTIADASESGFRYSWNFDDPASGGNNFSTLKDPVHVYTGTGPFRVNLRVMSNAGCVHDTTINVNSIHAQPISNFGMSKAAVCLGDAIYFTDSSNAMDGTTVQWNWDMGDGRLKNTQNVLYIYNAAQTYNISLYTINSHGCKSEPVVKQVSINPYPTVDAGPDRRMLEGGSIIINAVVTGTNLQYLWSPAQYLNDPRVIKPKCEAKNDILYTITVTGPGGCSVSDMMYVDVLKLPRIPNTFSPNNDRTNDLWEIQYLDEYTEQRTQVFTRTGQKVFESRGRYVPWDGRYKGKELPMDTYYYIIEAGNGRDPVTGFVTIIR